MGVILKFFDGGNGTGTNNFLTQRTLNFFFFLFCTTFHQQTLKKSPQSGFFF